MCAIRLEDRLYGIVVFKNPVFGKLISTKELQRLKGISQLGMPDELYFTKGFSRYEHSIGVLLLLRRFGASETEQIAGLLHDVSHTAFSHVIDWVYGSSESEDFQDSNHLALIERSSIPNVLKEYGYDYKEIANLNTFRLLDREIPELCVDRLDYSLRQLPFDKVPYYLENLQVIDGNIVFSSIESGLDFATAFLHMQVNHWAGYESASRYSLLSEILKYALSLGVIQEDDFWNDEQYVLNKLLESHKKGIINRLQILKNKPFPPLNQYKTTLVYKKFRYVDPKVLDGNSLIKISKISADFQKELKKQMNKNKRGVQVPIIPKTIM